MKNYLGQWGLLTLLIANVANTDPLLTDQSYNSLFSGRFQLFDPNDALIGELPNLNGKFNLVEGHGFLETPNDEFDRMYADTVVMVPWHGEPGSGWVQKNTFSWLHFKWRTRKGIAECTYIPDVYDECGGLLASGWQLISVTPKSYEYELVEGQFAGILLVDYRKDADVPVLSAMQVEFQGDDGSLVVGSIDTERDGVPGTRVLSGFYEGYTFSYNGRQDPVDTRHWRRFEIKDNSSVRLSRMQQLVWERKAKNYRQRPGDWVMSLDPRELSGKQNILILSNPSRYGLQQEVRMALETLKAH